MSFSITDFNSKINKYGVAKTNLFHVRITMPHCLEADYTGDFYSRDLQFFCRSVDIPDMTVETLDVYHQGTGMPTHRPNGFSLSNLSTIFMVDSEFRVKHFFHRWLQCIYNYSIDNMSGELDGALPFEIGYKKEYSTTVSVTQFSANSEENFYTYNYLNAFPKSIGSLALAWENQNEISTLPVSFTFDSVSPSGATPSDGMSTRVSRANSIIQRYLESQQLVNTIREFDSITDIQDAINRLTTVSSTLDRIF